MSNDRQATKERGTGADRQESLAQAVELINLKREHLKRLANQKGAAGELEVLAKNRHFVARPKGAALSLLMHALNETDIVIKKSSRSYSPR
jgi:hypothetical protein